MPFFCLEDVSRFEINVFEVLAGLHRLRRQYASCIMQCTKACQEKVKEKTKRVHRFQHAAEDSANSDARAVRLAPGVVKGGGGRVFHAF